jgi:hypothetical protein
MQSSFGHTKFTHNYRLPSRTGNCHHLVARARFFGQDHRMLKLSGGLSEESGIF